MPQVHLSLVRSPEDHAFVTEARWQAYATHGYSTELSEQMRHVDSQELESPYALFQMAVDGQVLGTIRGARYDAGETAPSLYPRGELPEGPLVCAERFAVWAPPKLRNWVKASLVAHLLEWAGETGAEVICGASQQALVPAYEAFGMTRLESRPDGILVPSHHALPFIIVVGAVPHVRARAQRLRELTLAAVEG